MRARSFIALTAALTATFTAALLAVTGVAHAKGADQATIEGGGLAAPIVLTGSEGAPGSLYDLAEAAGFFPSVFTQSPDPTLKLAPTSELGPKLTVRWRMPMGDTPASTILQDVYPFAVGGPLTYTASGQPFYGTEHTSGGWYRAPSSLTSLLVRLGVPEVPPLKAPPVAAQAAQAAAGQQSGWPAATVVVAALAALAVLGAAGLAARRRTRVVTS